MNLATQIRDYAAAVDAEQEPMGLDEIAQARLGTERVQPVGPRPPVAASKPRPRWLAAVGAAAAVLILVGGVAWLVRTPGPETPSP